MVAKGRGPIVQAKDGDVVVSREGSGNALTAG
jgi:hypothetical protein